MYVLLRLLLFLCLIKITVYYDLRGDLAFLSIIVLLLSVCEYTLMTEFGIFLIIILRSLITLFNFGSCFRGNTKLQSLTFFQFTAFFKSLPDEKFSHIAKYASHSTLTHYYKVFPGAILSDSIPGYITVTR